MLNAQPKCTEELTRKARPVANSFQLANGHAHLVKHKQTPPMLNSEIRV